MIGEAKHDRKPGQPGHNIDEAVRAAYERKPSKMKTFNEERGIWSEPYTATTRCAHCGIELRVKPELKLARCPSCRQVTNPCHVCDKRGKCHRSHKKPCGTLSYEAVSIVRFK